LRLFCFLLDLQSTILKMKKLVISLSALFFMSACGPAAEDRQRMHERAKVFQDSIANAIRSTMAEAESPATAPAPVPAQSGTPAASSNPTPQR
jgi:hypothetical protein